MIKIYFEKNNKMRLSLNLNEKEINLNRNSDESLEITFKKLILNLMKKLKATNQIIPIVSLRDQNNNVLSLDTKNDQAWKEDYIFKLNSQQFEIKVNLPFVKKIEISKVLIAGMTAIVQTHYDEDYVNNEAVKMNSKYFWYFGSNDEWNLIQSNSKCCILTKECCDSYIKF